ncbi:MAG: anhydro-N-acetylmuramic acid kinase [Neisseria sp.]|uniref:anhydro-N-acetylmuramic acid kinase n=1 Tax=Neisseria sp. TaxID=192066 RepID=UPI0026DAA20F|nr:anhydro-N-acetylmuramic acid kinase [Neisseria sp.]MDO4640741.1 anhydro-N-acetylmuramic acid kinase [Neisseria sp.]
MNDTQLYIGIMSGTSMDGADAVLIRMKGMQWQAAEAHAFTPYPNLLKQALLDLQNVGTNELHRSRLLAQELSLLYADTVRRLLTQTALPPSAITAIGCHGQTVRHAPEAAYSIQLAELPLLAEQTGIFTIGDFRSRDLAAGGQGAPLVPAFHEALFKSESETRVVLNIGGIANISILPPAVPAFGFDTGPGNMLMDAWVYHIWQQPYDRNGEQAAQGKVLNDLLAKLSAHPYFQLPPPKSTGRELFALDWLQAYLTGNENPNDVLRTLLELSARSIAEAIRRYAPDARHVYTGGGGIRNGLLMQTLQNLMQPDGIHLHSTAELRLDPQWLEAAAFGWLAACWIHRIPGNPHHATDARKPCILGAGHYA